jgi:hypothetical protein
MTFARRLLLALLCLLPLVTLVHKNDLGRWDVARSAMAAPDEFSYLLLADSFLHGRGVHLEAAIGRDAFYPPGYPAFLAAFCAPLGGLTLFRAHLLNALLLCACVLLAYFLAKRLLGHLNGAVHPRHRVSSRVLPWLALVCAAAFAVDWHVLEGALFVFSEPAFTLTTLAWLLLALRFPEWPASPLKTLPIAALAMLAYTIRGAGLVCVGATLLFALISQLPAMLPRGWGIPRPLHIRRRLASFALILVLAAGTKLLTRYTDNAPNSYPHQLVNGLTHGGQFSFARPGDWRAIDLRIEMLAASHLDDFAQAFTPIPRIDGDNGPLTFIGKTFALLALATWVLNLGGALRASWRSGAAPLLFVDLYLALYIGLYLLWPFNMARFWTPILPIALPYALHAGRTLAGATTPAAARLARFVPAAALVLLLVLNAEELLLHLGPYQNRLNYVSDALASAAATVARRSPDPAATFLCVEGGDEHFIFAWYLRDAGIVPRSPRERERLEAFIARTAADAQRVPGAKIFIVSYFDDYLFEEVFANLRAGDPRLMARYRPVRIYQKGIEVTLWELRPTLP